MATDLETAISVPIEYDEDASATDDCGSVVLGGISWDTYRKLRKMRDNCHIRMTYDQGELEIMSPSRDHEVIAALLGTLVEAWTEEQNIEILPCRTMTIRRADLKRGFEPDDCYYVQNELRMRNKRKPNFKVDPPPDLAIEVEVTRRLMNKLAIYASFRVPELWRWSKNSLTVLELSSEQLYIPRATSVCFPNFPFAKVAEVIRQQGTIGHTALIRSFREWVKANMGPPR